MKAWASQYCIYVSDLERTVAFYEAIGLHTSSRTDLQTTLEALMSDEGEREYQRGNGGRIQWAQKIPPDVPIDMGNAFWKLYVYTTDIERVFADAVAAGAEVMSEPTTTDRWPVSVAFVKDPDGYTVEFVQRDEPLFEGEPLSWVGQYCINVTDLDATVKFYEALGLTCTSRTDIPVAREAIMANPETGGKIQLAQQLDQDGPIDMGTAVWKLYVYGDDCQALYDAAMAAGATSETPPVVLDRWPVTMAYVKDPDGYLVEFVSYNE
jgi:lactoylglutathione lyase